MTNFLELYQTNQGLTSAQKRELVASLPNDITFDDTFSKSNLKPADLISLLNSYGPFWVTLDADPLNLQKQQAVVVTGISNETAENAQVACYNVASGTIERSNFSDFVKRVKDANEDLSECLIRRVNKAGEGGLPETYSISKTASIYILVAAINYSDDPKYSFFSDYTKAYMKKITAGKSGQENVFVVIDVAGSIMYFENDTQVAIKHYSKIGVDNYEGYDFVFKHRAGYLSKTFVYAVIAIIGEKNPGQVKEVDVFSHAVYKGPILVNTYEPGTEKFNKKYADDVLYQDLDFRMTDAAAINATALKAAFAGDFIFKIWGCYSFKALNVLLKTALRSDSYKHDGTTADAIEFSAPNDKIGDYKLSEWFPSYLNPLVSGDDKEVKITMGNLKKLLAYEYLNTYAASMAETLDITVQAALPSCYASIGATLKGESASNANIFRISYDTKENVKVFKEYLDVDTGELNYGLYTKASVTACKAI